METQPENETITSFPAFYVALEGPGSTGKTSIQRTLLSAFYELIGRGEGLPEIVTFSEAPEWEEFEKVGLDTPHRLTELRVLQGNPQAAVHYLAAIRRMMWTGASLDGKPLTPQLNEKINDPKSLLIASRSPMSLVYQGVYPGGTYPNAQDVYKFFYSWNIPFPDCLYVLIPNLQEQIKRLKQRIAQDGQVKDVGDDPRLQDTILKGYLGTLEIIHNWPGVYFIESQEVTSHRVLALSLIMSFHLLACIIEKGNIDTYSSPTHWGSPFYPRRSQLVRINTGMNDVRAYFFPGIIPSLLDYNFPLILEPMKSPKDYIPVFHGDIGALVNKNDLIIISIENQSVTRDEACGLVLAKLKSRDWTVVDRNTRYGRNIYPESRVERAWKNITW